MGEGEHLWTVYEAGPLLQEQLTDGVKPVHHHHQLVAQPHAKHIPVLRPQSLEQLQLVLVGQHAHVAEEGESPWTRRKPEVETEASDEEGGDENGQSQQER